VMGCAYPRSVFKQGAQSKTFPAGSHPTAIRKIQS
jgi:hypothetical protein